MTDHKVGDITVHVELDGIDVDTIKGKTPVRTGNLRDNFKLDIDGNIINLADYADEVEFGTTKSPGAFMVENSVEEIGARLADRVAKQLNNPAILKLSVIELKVK